MTFIANTSGEISFVKFFLENKLLRTELYPPYTAFGDASGIFNAWLNPMFNEWIKLNVSATSPDGFMNFKVYWMRLVRMK